MKGHKHYRILIPVLLLSVVPSLVRAQSSQYTALYSFNQDVEGDAPNQPNILAQGTDGNLYGTLPSGADLGAGSWFQYSMSGVPYIQNFGAYTSAQAPDSLGESNSGFTLGIDANLYGSVSKVDGADLGAIIRLTPPWPGAAASGPPTVVYKFTGGSNGTFPVAPPVQGTDFNLYGVTSDYGYSGYVYQILLNTSTGQGTLGWILQLPSRSLGPLLLGSDGNFYGTYVSGSFSTNSSGTVVPSWGGFGGVFQITPAGAIGWYYNLNPFSAINSGYGDGSGPQGGVMQAADGYLYATASGSGQYEGGVIFKIATNGTGYSVVHNFQPAEGTVPHGGLVQGSDGYLYGLTTSNGPAIPAQVQKFVPPAVTVGTLFKVSTTNTGYSVLIPFFGIPFWNYWGPGNDPEPTPVLHTNGILYGLTHSGGESGTALGAGAYNGGEFFSFKPGLIPFISIVGRRSAHVGDRVGIIGQGFSNPVGAATGVTFGGVPASTAKFQMIIWSDRYMEVVVPPGAKSGPVTVQETTGNLSTLYNFTISCSGIGCLHRP